MQCSVGGKKIYLRAFKHRIKDIYDYRATHWRIAGTAASAASAAYANVITNTFPNPFPNCEAQETKEIGRESKFRAVGFLSNIKYDQCMQ